MKAEKVTVKIEIESLSIDVLRGMLSGLIDQVEGGAISGELSMDDGDLIKWTTTYKPVEF
jgi:hypothetical protein